MALEWLPSGGDVASVSGAALFALAMGILVWPLVRKALQARRQRYHELRVAAGDLPERK